MSNFRIEHIKDFNPTLITPINNLLKQLTSHEIIFTEQKLHTLLNSEANHLFILYDNERVTGMLTLGIYSSPTGVKAWIEDVVIDIEYRGKGLGHTLIQHAVAFARQYTPCMLALTSNPSRIEANALYKSEGFEQRCTNVYKMDL